MHSLELTLSPSFLPFPYSLLPLESTFATPSSLSPSFTLWVGVGKKPLPLTLSFPLPLSLVSWPCNWHCGYGRAWWLLFLPLLWWLLLLLRAHDLVLAPLAANPPG